MADRVLVVEERRPIAAALRAHLEVAGFAADVVDETGAVAAAGPEHSFAIVRAARRDLERALRERDPSLLVVLLFDDDDAALAAAHEPPADGVLVGPLFGPVVGATARAMARLRGEARRAAGGAGPGRDRDDFRFYRRVLLMEVKRARRYRYPLALAALAIDRWPELGPGLGPEGRARVLGDVLAQLARSVREVDLPLLHNAERFLIVMPHTDADGALRVAQRLCDRVREVSAPVPLAASCGIASFSGEGPISLASLLAEATSGIEAARASGGGTAARGTPVRRDRGNAGGAEA